MRTEEVTDGSRLSAATRFESLVRVSNAIGTHRDPQELFGALVRELHRVVRFDYIGVSIRDEKSNTFHRHSVDAETEIALAPDPELARPELHQRQSRPHRAWNEVDRPTASAGSSGRSSFQPLGAAARHSPGRGTIDSRQRSDRSSESSLLPTNQLDCDKWISEFSAYQLVYRSSWVVEFRRITGTAYLRRGKNSFRCEAFRSAATGNTADLPADNPAGLSWSFGCASRIPQRPGVPGAAGTTRVFRSRRGATF